MHNVGHKAYRLNDPINRLELLFAREWERQHTTQYGELKHDGMIDQLLAVYADEPRGEVTERDRMIAATVIQWLGSPVGQHFLETVTNRAKKEWLLR